jgi:hypothetical protein
LAQGTPQQATGLKVGFSKNEAATSKIWSTADRARSVFVARDCIFSPNFGAVFHQTCIFAAICATTLFSYMSHQ